MLCFFTDGDERGLLLDNNNKFIVQFSNALFLILLSLKIYRCKYFKPFILNKLALHQVNSARLKEWEYLAPFLENREPDAPTTIVLPLKIKLVEY